jgi:hypothetical protein
MLPDLHLFVLHHLHLAIAFDVLLHSLTVGLSFLALFWTFKFSKAIKDHPRTTKGARGLSYAMILIVVYIIYNTLASFYVCAVQYHQWWNR